MPHDRQAVGHSDADVLLHAITDALLGAAGLPDIGELFPNTDPANRGRNSADFLRAAHDKVKAAGYELANLDCVIAAQRPKLSPYKDAMRHAVAGILGVNPNQSRRQGKDRRRSRAGGAGGGDRGPVRGASPRLAAKSWRLATQATFPRPA